MGCGAKAWHESCEEEEYTKSLSKFTSIPQKAAHRDLRIVLDNLEDLNANIGALSRTQWSRLDKVLSILRSMV